MMLHVMSAALAPAGIGADHMMFAYFHSGNLLKKSGSSFLITLLRTVNTSTAPTVRNSGQDDSVYPYGDECGLCAFQGEGQKASQKR